MIKSSAFGVKEEDVFGQRTVLGSAFSLGFGKDDWWVVVRCSCERVDVVPAKTLKYGGVTKCMDCRIFESIKHGKSYSSLYEVWKNMMARCYDEDNNSYQDYGGRGITVCEEWHDVEAFIAWTEKESPTEDLQIDRKNNDLGYFPENCHFVTKKINCNNRRTSRILTAFGESKTVAQWAEDPRCKVGYNTLHARIQKGEKAEEAISRPSKYAHLASA